jgi:hypothetical protein
MGTAFPSSADTTAAGPPMPVPGPSTPGNAEPNALTSPSTAIDASAADGLNALTTVLNDEVADIDELIVDAHELAGDTNELRLSRPSDRLRLEFDNCSGCASR